MIKFQFTGIQKKFKWSFLLADVQRPILGSHLLAHRPCGDYRLLNSVRRPNSYPLPTMSDNLGRISGKTVFSTLDLKKEFHQIHETDINKTAVMTFFGLFEYTTMPFGLRNASQMFQINIDALLHGTVAVNNICHI